MRARASLRDGHAFVDCVGEEASGTTNAQVSQALLIAPLEEQISTVVRDVARLEREKAQWMELYAQSEIEFSAMVSQSTSDAAAAEAAVWFMLFSRTPKGAVLKIFVERYQKAKPRSAAVIDMLKPQPIFKPR